uniref:P-loop NTPase n=1 Tax=Eubacterium cellulosolvens TaxID=29322 RepID=UPI00054E39BB
MKQWEWSKIMKHLTEKSEELLIKKYHNEKNVDEDSSRQNTYINNFFGSVNDIQIQQGTNSSNQTDTVSWPRIKTENILRSWIPGASKLELTYRYNVENLPLIGRDTEKEILKTFCKEADPFLWYALCGPGGSGKSRLAYEFARMMQTGGWEVFWLKEGEYAKLSEATFKTEKPILIIADYVLMHTDAIGKFIEKMNEASTTIRLLLIERAGQDLSKSQDMREYPIWNSLRMRSKIKTGQLEDTLYKNDQREFLFLNPLTDEALLEVIENYAKQIPDCKKTLSTQDTKIILKRLYEVDPKYRRPLYARILVLLWANDEEWENYSVTRLMQKVLDREIDRWMKFFREVEDDNTCDKARSCLMKLLAIVTMNGGMTEESLKNMYPGICDEMSKYLAKDLPAFFEENEMVDLTSDGDNLFCSVEPDLFGEYLVLKWLTVPLNGMGDRLNILFDGKWYENTNKTQFLLRLIDDYEETITNTNKLGELFWKTVITHDITEMSYWEFLAETASLDRVSLELRRNIGDSFEKSVEKNDDILYAITLFYLHYYEDVEGKRTYIKQLEYLSKKHEGNAEIALAYAKGLVNQCCDEELSGRRSCVAKLEELHKVYAENAEIALEYAQGLFNLSFKEDLSGARRCVAKLE